jgi:hypothetical protein
MVLMLSPDLKTLGNVSGSINQIPFANFEIDNVFAGTRFL